MDQLHTANKVCGGCCAISLNTVDTESSVSPKEGWQYHSLVEFQLGVKLDSMSLPDICTESSECHTGFCNSGSDLIQSMCTALERVLSR